MYKSADSNYNNESSLTFYYGTPTGTAGTDYYQGYDTAHYTGANEVPWHGKYSTTKHVVFDSTVQNNLKPSSTAYWFSDFSSLKDVTGLLYLNTSNVTDMNRMFYSCSALTSLDLSVLDTSNVKNMEKLLYDCWNLSSLTLGGSFSTANVTDMDNMFGACKALTTLDATQISTVAAISMSGMFSGCSALTSLDLTGFNASNVTDMTSMFSGCTNLATLTLGDNFSTSKISSMYAMFSACESLQTLTWPSNIDTSNVTTMKQMFHGCKALTDPGLGSLIRRT